MRTVGRIYGDEGDRRPPSPEKGKKRLKPEKKEAERDVPDVRRVPADGRHGK